MRDRKYRRNFRDKKIKQRQKILKESGYKGGSLYEKHIKKIEDNGFGYMSKSGTLLHYVRGTNKPSQKVRDRNSYNGTNNWGHRDSQRMDSMSDNEKDLLK